jgi:hypothetical protein
MTVPAPFVPTAPLDADRFRDAIIGILRTLLTGPELLTSMAPYLKWEYTVQSVEPGPPVLISGTPVNPNCPFGSLANITLWPGPDGGYATPIPGSRVLIEFHDGSPAKPAVCGLDPNTNPIQVDFGLEAESFIALAIPNDANWVAATTLATALGVYAGAIAAIADPTGSATTALTTAITAFEASVKATLSTLVRSQ